MNQANLGKEIVIKSSGTLTRVATSSLTRRGLADLEMSEKADEWLAKAREHFSEYTSRMTAFLGSHKINFHSKRDCKAFDTWCNSNEQLATMKAYIDCLNRAVDAKPGYPKALMEIAEAYFKGWGVTKSRDEALRLLWTAAANASPRDLWEMSSVIVLEGHGIDPWPEGMKEAEKMCRIAAEQGDAGAQYSLGEMYVKGEGGLPRDDELALYWFKRAAENGEFPPAEGELQYWKSKQGKERPRRQ